jgi:hypothetical protein
LVLGRYGFDLSSATPYERQHLEHASSIMSDASERDGTIADGLSSHHTK